MTAQRALSEARESLEKAVLELRSTHFYRDRNSLFGLKMHEITFHGNYLKWHL